MEFDLIASEKNFTVLVALAAFVVFWAVWTAVTWKPPIEARLKALQTRRMKTRSEQTVVAAKPSSKATSIGFMRSVANRLNLLRGIRRRDQTTRKLRLAGFLSRDATVVFVFVKLALPLALGFLMIVLTSITGIIQVSEDLVLPVCVGAVLAGFVLPEAYVKNVTQKRRETLNFTAVPRGSTC